MDICAYGAILEPNLGRISVDETIESLYDHVDSFVIVDCSKHDSWDWTRYSKIKKYIRTIYNPLDNPFGSMFNLAYQYVDSDYSLFLDLDEIFEFPSNKSLKDIARPYDLRNLGLSFFLRHYYCSRHFIFDAVPTKGCHLFMTNNKYAHDIIPMQATTDGFRRFNVDKNLNDGVRIINRETGATIEHYPYHDTRDVFVHHTSHLDYYGKLVRSLIQMGHVTTIDTPNYYPTDVRLTPDMITKIYGLANAEIREGELDFFQIKAVPINYVGNELLDRYVTRFGIQEFDPRLMSGYKEKYGEVNA